MKLTHQDIVLAAQKIAPYISRTPVKTSTEINQLAGCEIYFKCENLQTGGAFKFRGACNAVFSLTDREAEKGVATHSSGNHGQALARAARLRNIPAYIVMPKTAPLVKQNAAKKQGAEVTLCEPTMAAREAAIAEVLERTGATLIHSYNDRRIIAGQGTAALELIQEIPDLEIVTTPVSGGGLVSGTCLAVKGVSPQTLIIGAEPAVADDARRSLEAGKIIPANDPETLADGLRASLGSETFAIIREHVSRIVTASEEGILKAMGIVHRHLGMWIEPSSAVALAAILENKSLFYKKRVGLIVSGGNIDESLIHRVPSA
jgi:threonine dehydratase